MRQQNKVPALFSGGHQQISKQFYIPGDILQMTKYKAFLFPLLVCTTLLLSACKAPDPPFVCNDAIGCVTVTSGQLRGIQLALDKRNNQLLDHPIKLQTEDERCTSEGGTIAAMKIVANPQIVAVLGTSCSGAAITAGKVISDAGMSMISGLNTALSLTEVDGERGAHWQPGYFRTSYNDEKVMGAVATFIFQELGVTKVATINDGDLYTRGYTDGLKRAFLKLGGEIVLDATIDKGDTDMHPVLAAVAQSEAELLFIPLFPQEGSFIVQQAREVEGVKSVKILGADPLFSEKFLNSAHTAAAGMYFIAKLSPKTSAFAELSSAYKEKYDEVPGKPTYGFAYDAANTLFNALKKVAVKEPDGTLHIGRHALREELRSTADVDGVMGRINCDAFGDCASGILNIIRFDDMAAGFAGLEANVIYTSTLKPLPQTSQSPLR